MRFWLTARDGSVSYQCEAPDAGQAFELMAKHLRYSSFAAFSADLGYSPGDFQVATIAVESREYDPEGNRKMIDQQQGGIMQSAFKHLRRLGQ